jgi:hypothetical protein
MNKSQIELSTMKKNLLFLLFVFGVNAASSFAAAPIEPRSETADRF